MSKEPEWRQLEFDLLIDASDTTPTSIQSDNSPRAQKPSRIEIIAEDIKERRKTYQPDWKRVKKK